ncbi:MAG: YceD family protein, partial [Acidobacteriaceae bacterium]
KGLCPRCGRNLNTEPCACEGTPSDPRWTALSDLRSRLSPENH